MDEDVDTPWWQTALRGVGILLGLMVLSALLMGGIVLVARFLDNARLPATHSSAPITSSRPPPAEQNARTRVAIPYAPQTWPDTPSRRPGATNGSGGGRSSSGNSSGPASPPRPSVPVGISVDAYRAAVADGKRVFLPDPKGECNLSGTNTATSLNSLESCFANQAAR